MKRLTGEIDQIISELKVEPNDSAAETRGRFLGQLKEGKKFYQGMLQDMNALEKRRKRHEERARGFRREAAAVGRTIRRYQAAIDDLKQGLE
jgi:hypothetical protein